MDDNVDSSSQSTALIQAEITFMDIHGSQRMDSNNCGDPLYL